MFDLQVDAKLASNGEGRMLVDETNLKDTDLYLQATDNFEKDNESDHTERLSTSELEDFVKILREKKKERSKAMMCTRSADKSLNTASDKLSDKKSNTKSNATSISTPTRTKKNSTSKECRRSNHKTACAQ